MERVDGGPLPINPSYHGPIAGAKITFSGVWRRFSDSALCCCRGVVVICTSVDVDWRACNSGAGCLVVGSNLIAGLALSGGSTAGGGATSSMMSGSIGGDGCLPASHAVFMNFFSGTGERGIRR